MAEVACVNEKLHIGNKRSPYKNSKYTILCPSNKTLFHLFPTQSNIEGS